MIHWKISQKLGELYVKEPGLPVENAVLLFFETAKLTGDSRTSDQAELMEKLISVSENLTEKGMHHHKIPSDINAETGKCFSDIFFLAVWERFCL